MNIKNEFTNKKNWLEELPFPFAIYRGIDLNGKHYPPFPPDVNVAIVDIPGLEDVDHLKKILEQAYPPDHKLLVYSLEVNGKINKAKFSLADLMGENITRFPVDVQIPAREKGTSFENFAEIVAHLRAPDGCPWDREQTHLSLRPHLLEEAYEVLQAMDTQEPESLEEELGDLLLQIVLNAQIAAENTHFTMTDVIKAIHKKIVRRHPHVFADVQIQGVDGVLKNWEKLKAEERRLEPVNGKTGLLEGVPKALPALTQAQEYQDRAARVGFDWKTIEPVIEKVNEELHEVKTASAGDELAHELGDLLFAVVNYIRWSHMDAESLLRAANQRFVQRFKFIEETAHNQKKQVSDLSFEEMDLLWEQAKKETKK